MEGVDPTEDAVGRTSARLLAAGVPSSERLDALQLLAVLDASADGFGRVRRPLDDLADEFELDHAVVFRALDHLEAAGAIVREGATVLLPRHGEGAVGGMLLADFLADVRSALEDEPARPSRSHLVARASAGLVAAAALVVVALVVPGGGGATTTTIAAPSSSAGSPAAEVDEDATSTTVAATDAGPSSSTSSAPQRPTTTALAADGSPTTLLTIACPAEGPLAEVDSDPENLGETAATVGSAPAISGTATNPTAHDLQITAMTVRNGTTEGNLAEPLVVPAGETVTFSVAAARLNVLDPAGAVIDEWEWTDPAVRGCPS